MTAPRLSTPSATARVQRSAVAAAAAAAEAPCTPSACGSPRPSERSSSAAAQPSPSSSSSELSTGWGASRECPVRRSAPNDLYTHALFRRPVGDRAFHEAAPIPPTGRGRGVERSARASVRTPACAVAVRATIVGCGICPPAPRRPRWDLLAQQLQAALESKAPWARGAARTRSSPPPPHGQHRRASPACAVAVRARATPAS